MRGYCKTESGTLEIVTLAVIDGQVYTPAGTPLTPTGEQVTLMGWPDTAAAVYATELGDEFLVPANTMTTTTIEIDGWWQEACAACPMAGKEDTSIDALEWALMPGNILPGPEWD